LKTTKTEAASLKQQFANCNSKREAEDEHASSIRKR
jgi:hypothetical protein